MHGEEEKDIPFPDASKIQEWQNECGARLECPICGNPQWTVIGDLDAVAGIQLMLDPRGNATQKHLRLLFLICTRCAFVRQHAVNAFQTWLLQKGPKGPKV